MDFNFEIQLLGYYNVIDQRMNAEKKSVEDAENLASLFAKSFAEAEIDEDSWFATLLKERTVFIFRNRNNWYYAYYPYEHIARINGVRYDREAITTVPREYKNWFIPGMPFIIEKDAIDVQFCDLKKNWHSVEIYPNSIYRYIDEYRIRLDGSVYPILLKKSIGIEKIHSLITHEWTCLVEKYTSDYCQNCDDKWDYSGCDEDRCRDDCEGCGGRKLKCPSCFCHIHEVAIVINYLGNVVRKDLDEGERILEKIMEPHSKGADSLWEEEQPLFSSLLRDCYLLEEYFGPIEFVESYTQKYKQAKKLQDIRHSNIKTLDIYERSNGQNRLYRISLKNLHVKKESAGFLWLQKIYTLSFKAYDFLSDTFIERKYPLDRTRKYSFFNDDNNKNKLICINLFLLKNGTYSCEIISR